MILDLVGQKFERLTVLSSAGKNSRGRLWKCKCDCGNEVIVATGSLRSGNNRSCGCLLADTIREKVGIDMTGAASGFLTYIKDAPNKGRRRILECLCACGNTKLVSREEFLNGDTKSCGCLRLQSARHGKWEQNRLNNLSKTENECRKCKQTKPESKFYRHPKTGRLFNICYDCQVIYTRERKKQCASPS